MAEFSTLKTLQGSAFDKFRNFFKARLEKCFVVPSYTFDNVKGKFPIGFKIWNTSEKEKFNKVITDAFGDEGILIDKKVFYSYEKSQFINKWISKYKTISQNTIGYMDGINGNDFQHNNIVYILNTKGQLPNPRGIWIINENLIAVAVYYTVRKCIKSTWLNDRDQFLYPDDNWEYDNNFKNDCLTFTLFSNNIQSCYGINYWIPFTEHEVNAKEKFQSNFMSKFISGKLKPETNLDLFGLKIGRMAPLVLSPEAQTVFDAGRQVWKYYHAQPNNNVNASLYDIREYFQGRNTQGKMNNKSDDEDYNILITNLRASLKTLATKTIPKIYEYGFLRD